MARSASGIARGAVLFSGVVRQRNTDADTNSFAYPHSFSDAHPKPYSYT